MHLPHTSFLKKTAQWGFLLWLFGFVLSIALFFFVPSFLLGWVIMPCGIAATVWVLHNKMGAHTWHEWQWVAGIWTLLAVVLDYVCIVTFIGALGYYRLDVFLYYLLTAGIPLYYGYRSSRI